MLHFEDNVYGFNHFVFWLNEPKLKKFEKKHKIEEFDGHYQCLRHQDSPDYHQLIVYRFSEEFKKKSLEEQVKIISHEAYHGAELTLSLIGCDVNWGGVNEHLAYYIGFISENLTKYYLDGIVNN